MRICEDGLSSPVAIFGFHHGKNSSTEAESLDEVRLSVENKSLSCCNLQLTGGIIRGDKTAQDRLHVDFWRPPEKIYVDVRVFDPNCKTYKGMKTL